jgi:hypothetical protein
VVDGQAELAMAFLSTGNYYRLLGINARVGRTIMCSRSLLLRDQYHPPILRRSLLTEGT